MLWVTMGMPGAGKTTWARRHATETGATVISSDAIRTDDVNPKQWFMRMHSSVEACLLEGTDVVVDACNTTTDQRRRWLEQGKRHNARCTLVVLATPGKTALERNLQRPSGQQVPHAKMLRYSEQFASATIVARSEAWDDVLVVGSATSDDVVRPVSTVQTSRTW